MTLLAELRRRAPEAINWGGMQEVVPLLDAFEAAMESKVARRHRRHRGRIAALTH